MEQQLHVEGEGTALLRFDKGTAEIIVEHSNDGLGLYKAWLYGDKGKQLLVGTLSPEGKSLKWKRRFTIRDLESNGCWPIKGCIIKLVFSFEHRNWYCEKSPESLIVDPVLKGQIKGPMMCCRDGDSVFLAAPFKKENFVMLDTAFCLGKVEMVHGSPYIMWEFSKSGQLLCPGKTQETEKA